MSFNVKIYLFFRIKSLLTFHHLIRQKFRFDSKKVFKKINPILKLCIILLTKNNICLIMIHRCKCYLFNSDHRSLIESAVGTPLPADRLARVRRLKRPIPLSNLTRTPFKILILPFSFSPGRSHTHRWT